MAFDEVMNHFAFGSKVKKQKGFKKAVADIRRRGEPRPGIPPYVAKELRVLGAFLNKAGFAKRKHKYAVSTAFGQLVAAVSGGRDISNELESLDLDADDLSHQWIEKNTIRGLYLPLEDNYTLLLGKTAKGRAPKLFELLEMV
jgi:hypothetical protein